MEGYREIGTAEEFKALKAENAELHSEAQAERALLDKRDAEIRAKAIDEAIEKMKNWLEEINGLSIIDIREIDEIAEQLKGGAT